MFNIKIADFVIGIDNKFDFVHKMCVSSGGYITDEKPLFCVGVTRQEIDNERAQSEYEFSDGYLESVCMYRNICLKLPVFDALLFHCAVVKVEGCAYAFAAKSGTGKSTHLLLWQKLLGDKMSIINGDKPIFRKVNDEIIAYGTPWCGKENLQTNDCAPLKAICFLERSSENKVSVLEKDIVTRKSMHQIIVPPAPMCAVKTLEMLDFIIKNVKCYRLECNMDISAAEICYNTIKEKNDEN